MPEALVPNFDQLLGEYRAKSADQNAALKQYLDNMFSAQEKNANRASQVDLSPAMAWFDSQFGSNLQRGYSKPQGADEIQAQSDQYNNAVNQARLGIPKADMESLKTQLDYMFRKDQMDQNAELKNATLQAQKDKPGQDKNVFFDTLNKDLAKQTGEYIGGGKAEAESNIGIVRDAVSQLKLNPELTGPGKGSIPLKGVFLPELKSLQDKMGTAVGGSLRPILGSAFTAEEGKRIISQAFDPDLSAEENIYRINRLLNKIESAKQSKEAAIDYIAKNGTIKGYPGLQFSKADFENQDWSAGYKKGGSNTDTPENEKALSWAKQNPNDPRAKQIMEKLGAK